MDKKYDKEPRFNIVYNKEVYEFLRSLPEKAQDKIVSNLDKSRFVLDQELFKKPEGEIWEFRTLYNKIHYRLFAFWDKEQQRVVVVSHGIIKKTDETPKKEIEKAEAFMREYYKSKNQ